MRTQVVRLAVAAWGVFLVLPLAIAWADGVPAEARLAVPEAAARQKAEQSIEEVFGREIAAAKTLAQQTAIIDKLMSVAREEKDLGQRYGLMSRARSIAIAAGEARLALRVAAEMVNVYQIDASRAALATLQAVAKSSPAEGQEAQLAESAAAMLEDAITRDNLEAAMELGAMALAAAKKSHNTELQKRLVRRGKELQEIRRAAAEAEPFRAKLASNPADPEANLAVGRYHCLARHDWKTGLPMLARGSDADLKAAAQRELMEPDEAEGQLQLADRWWGLAEKAEGGAQEALYARGQLWYRKALPQLTGLDRARAEKRLADASSPAATTATAATSSAAVTTKSPEPGGRTPTTSAGGQRALINYIAQEMKAGKTQKSEYAGSTSSSSYRQPYSIVVDGGGLMVGVDLGIDRFDRIVTIRPIFLTNKAQVLGSVVGPAGTKVVRILAKKGYAVGAIVVSAAGSSVEGFGVVFLRIEAGGLDLQQTYESGWVGAVPVVTGRRLGGTDGDPVVGLHGQYDERMRRITSVGVVQVKRRPAASD
jgi:hypothetical protein